MAKNQKKLKHGPKRERTDRFSRKRRRNLRQAEGRKFQRKKRQEESINKRQQEKGRVVLLGGNKLHSEKKAGDRYQKGNPEKKVRRDRKSRNTTQSLRASAVEKKQPIKRSHAHRGPGPGGERAELPRDVIGKKGQKKKKRPALAKRKKTTPLTAQATMVEKKKTVLASSFWKMWKARRGDQEDWNKKRGYNKKNNTKKEERTKTNSPPRMHTAWGGGI